MLRIFPLISFFLFPPLSLFLLQREPNAASEAVEHPVSEVDGRFGDDSLFFLHEAVQYYRAQASLPQLRGRLLRRMHGKQRQRSLLQETPKSLRDLLQRTQKCLTTLFFFMGGRVGVSRHGGDELVWGISPAGSVPGWSLGFHLGLLVLA